MTKTVSVLLAALGLTSTATAQPYYRTPPLVLAKNDNTPFPGISAKCGSTGCKTRQSNEKECRADKKRLLECLNQGDNNGYGMICHRALYSCLKGVD
jgi:hypothetical protein